MSEQRKKLKTWQGWAIFGGAMVFVFCLVVFWRHL